MFKENVEKQNDKCVVSTGSGKKRKYVEISPDAKDGENLVKSTACFTPEYNRLQDRTVWFIYGASGCGKSTLIKSIVESYVRLDKKNKERVFLISAKPEDPTLDSLKYIKRLNLAKIAEIPFELSKDLKDSLFIMDDTEAISDEAQKNAVYFGMLKKILELGRSYKINCCISSHLPNHKFNKLCIFECHYLYTFLNSGSWYHHEYILTNYAGVDKKELKKLKKKDSRWCGFHKSHPNFYITQHEVGKIGGED